MVLKNKRRRGPRLEKPTVGLRLGVPADSSCQIFVRIGGISHGSLLLTPRGVTYAKGKMIGKRQKQVLSFATLEALCKIQTEG